MFGSEQTGGSGQTGIIYIGYYEQRWLSFLVKSIVDCTKPHRANTGKDSHLPAFPDAHFMIIGTRGHMVACMKGPDNT